MFETMPSSLQMESPALPTLVNMQPSECTIICAEPGMGRTTCLTRAVSVFFQRGDKASYIDCQGMTAEEIVHELKKFLRRLCVKNEDVTSCKTLLALDNVYVEDEADADMIAGVLNRIIEERASIALSTTPECEMLAEMIPTKVCFWSSDLRMRHERSEQDDEYDQYANGIPCLVDALDKAFSNGSATVSADPSYQEPYIGMVTSTVRRGMMNEEKRLRMAMLLLGSGDKAELEQVTGLIEDELWLSIVRDAPFLGAEAVRGTFSCVGAHSLDCLHLAYSALCTLTQDCPELSVRAARLLIGRQQYSRAALVGSMCSDPRERHALLLEFGPQMINAGEVAVVIDALDESRELGQTTLPGYAETACVLAALGERGHSGMSYEHEKIGFGQSGRYAAMARWCRNLHRGMGLGDEAPAWASLQEDDSVMDALLAHGNTMRLIAAGTIGAAYEKLLDNSSRLKEKSVSSAIAQMDYMLCSLLVGVAPSELDYETMEDHLLFLEKSGLVSLTTAYDAMLSSCALLSGRTLPHGSLEAHIHRAERAGDTFVRALLLVAASVSDMRVGALTRGHVRLEQAMRAFNGIGCEALSKVATLLDLALRSELGERILRPEIQACRGATKNIDRASTVLAAALSSSLPSKPVGSGRWGSVGCPRDVLWLINVLMNDYGGVSERFVRVMPTAWKDSAMRSVVEVDNYLERIAGKGEKAAEEKRDKGRVESQESLSTNKKPVHMSMLGGFEVLVEGLPISSGRLERRRAKALLALLAAVPGHRAKRFVIMESVWPTHDYESANKCLYSATSVLRKEIGYLLGTDVDHSLITTNKAEGTISLDPSVFDCDIDAFESAAHELLDIEGDDRRVVTTCRRVEELYKGDLFVPPTDGVGVVETRARELKTLFSDVMIAGSSAAGRLGMKSLACRFAKKAHGADNVREDAMRALAIALCAAGRHTEAERCYEQFVGRVVDITKRPPSRQLRKVVEELLSGKPQKKGARPRKGLSSVAKNATKISGNAAAGQLSFSFDTDEFSQSQAADG